ncbi:MAG: hypothetical protein MUC60_12195 [Oscillatoria sp. Prado101]|nr:hypothetical protein [Oscillatoria sp. Prado101]
MNKITAREIPETGFLKETRFLNPTGTFLTPPKSQHKLRCHHPHTLDTGDVPSAVSLLALYPTAKGQEPLARTGTVRIGAPTAHAPLCHSQPNGRAEQKIFLHLSDP